MVTGPAITPATALGEAERPRAVVPAAPIVSPAPAPADPPPLTLGVAEAIGGDAALVTCARGHRFALLSDHPTIDGRVACPHCMAKTLGDYRQIFAAIVRPVRYE